MNKFEDTPIREPFLPEAEVRAGPHQELERWLCFPF